MKNQRLRALEQLQKAIRNGEKALAELNAMPPLVHADEIHQRFQAVRTQAERLTAQRQALVNAIGTALGNHGRIDHMTRAEVGQLVMQLVNG